MSKRCVHCVDESTTVCSKGSLEEEGCEVYIKNANKRVQVFGARKAVIIEEIDMLGDGVGLSAFIKSEEIEFDLDGVPNFAYGLDGDQNNEQNFAPVSYAGKMFGLLKEQYKQHGWPKNRPKKSTSKKKFRSSGAFRKR